MALNIVDYVRKCPYGFKRHAWQSVQSGRMPELVGREAEHHDRRRPFLVIDYFAGVWHICLSLIYIQHVQTARMQDLIHYFQLGFIHDIFLAPGNLGEGCFGDVILRWAKAACRDNYIVVSQFIGKIVHYLVMVVPE